MKSYKAMYDQAVEEKAVKQLTPEYMKWNKPDEQVIGVFISRGEVDSSAGGGKCYQYVFATDKGRVKFHMGRATDIDVGASLVPGIIYCITFLGKEEISDTRSVNKFNIEEIGPSVDYAGPTSDEPKDE